MFGSAQLPARVAGRRRGGSERGMNISLPLIKIEFFDKWRIIFIRMGTGCRIFFVNDDDSVQRLPLARLERLLHFDRRESLPQYAGKRVRGAMVFLEVAGRHVLFISNIDYFLLQFNDKGQIDKKVWEKGMRLGMDLLPPLSDEEHQKKVVKASHRFAKRRYEHEFKWKPSRKVENAIVTAVFQFNVKKL
jgi:hypothetical protein